MEDGGDPDHLLENGLDTRCGVCPPAIASELIALARECCKTHKRRASSVDALTRLLLVSNEMGEDSDSRRLLDATMQHLVCPLTLDLFSDPVVTPYGFTYERGALLAHLGYSQTDPLHRGRLTADQIVANIAVRHATEAYRAAQQDN